MTAFVCIVRKCASISMNEHLSTNVYPECSTPIAYCSCTSLTNVRSRPRMKKLTRVVYDCVVAREGGGNVSWRCRELCVGENAPAPEKIDITRISISIKVRVDFHACDLIGGRCANDLRSEDVPCPLTRELFIRLSSRSLSFCPPPTHTAWPQRLR